MRSPARLATAALLCSLMRLAFATPGDSADDPIVLPFSTFSNRYTEVYNDRIGNSRFFSGANTDRVRISTFVNPTRDSDTYALLNPADGRWYRSTNGAGTRLSLSHPSMAGLADPQPMVFTGLTSGRGGAYGEFTWSYNRADPVVAALLAAWDATPFSLTATNPQLNAATRTLTYATADYDRNAMPGFVTDVRLTGGGLNPRLDWTWPTSGTTPTAVTIQVRRIDADAGGRITSATLVHRAALAADATSYTFNETFSSAALEGFPSGLEVGRRYEVALQLTVATNGQWKGLSRTLFEMAPLPDGGNQLAVYLPSVGPDGRFKFDIAVQQGESYAIDPEVSVGYDYAVGSGDPLFRSVKLPSIGDDQYRLLLWDGNDYSFQSALSAGTEYFFSGTGVDRFRIDGIEPSAGLNPADPAAFVTVVSFADSGRFTGTMTPLTVTVVPEPATLALWAGGLLFLGSRLRQRA